MPIVECPECGEMYSTHAGECPKCGGSGEQGEEVSALEDREDRSGPREVVVADVKMSFGNMVAFMVKWALASIPAALILGFVFWMGWMLVVGALSSGVN